MRVAIAQFAVAREPDRNIETIRTYAMQAAANGARVLLLPEGIIARDATDPYYPAHHAQPIDGPFVTALRAISTQTGIAIMGTVHISASESAKPGNVFLIIDGGEIQLAYRKIHLYDAFGERESDVIEPGNEIPPLIGIDGWRFGVMTCYDLRFPELARAHAIAGADVLVVSAAWARGTDKVDHWTTLCKARALENTCYLMACSEHSAHNIGHSIAVDPMAHVVAQAGDDDDIVFADFDRDVLDKARQTLPVLRNRRFAAPVLQDSPRTTD